MASPTTSGVGHPGQTGAAPSSTVMPARGMSPAELTDVRHQAANLTRQFSELERRPVVTTQEANALGSHLRELVRRAEDLARPRRVSRPDADRLRQSGRAVLAEVKKGREIIAAIQRRAAKGRSTTGLRLISDFYITPNVIRVHEGEAARIGFTLRRPVRRLGVEIWQYLDSSEERQGGWHFATWKDPPRDRYQDTFWDATWEGMRNRPPDTGTYRVTMEASDDVGTERVYGYVRVENPQRRTVLPRNGSGLDLVSLEFDGTSAVLTDSGNNAISMRATSGWRSNNPHSGGRDRTHPRHQWHRGGPVPEGRYHIARSGVQQPAVITVKGRAMLGYPTGGLVGTWGYRRAPLVPNKVIGPQKQMRDGFFFHLDIGNDGTAGCIGVRREDEGKLNQVMSLISRMRNASGTIPVIVRYRRQ
jgi:hypothetical protein